MIDSEKSNDNKRLEEILEIHKSKAEFFYDFSIESRKPRQWYLQMLEIC